MAKSPEEMKAEILANLKEKTGKDLATWLKILKGPRATKHGEMVKYLKAEHRVTHGFANMIAQAALAAESGGAATGDELIEAQYAGAKSAVRPIYDALIKLVLRFGKDVEVSPKKAYVSLRRSKQFALIQPSTATRVDVGLFLKGVEPSARLEASGTFNAMCSHRVRLASLKEIDAELETWLRTAYERA